MQAEAFNDSAIRTVVCVAITSRLALAEAPGNVRLSARESGLPKASVANVSQVVTVDKSFLTERVKSVNPRKFQSVKEGLRLLMGL